MSDTSDMINLGPLGTFSPTTVWISLTFIILFILGIAVLVYRRYRKVHSNDATDEEEAMAKSSNTIGWFGENKKLSEADKRVPMRDVKVEMEAASRPKTPKTKSRSASSSKRHQTERRDEKRHQQRQVRRAARTEDSSDED